MNSEILDLSIVIYSVVVLVFITTTFIAFFVVFQKRKNQLLIDKIKQQQQFEEELSKTQQEIQEETLKHVGRELHDNVGQLLSFATMQMNTAFKDVEGTAKMKVENASNALKESLSAVRALSKSLNTDVIFNLGFIASLKNEVQRMNKSGLLVAELNLDGEIGELKNKKDEMILFRILQEFFSNTLKYAKAENLTVNLDYGNSELKIKVEDDGVGFNLENAEQGSGMTNMKKRAELLNAEFNLESRPEKGTTLYLIYPYR